MNQVFPEGLVSDDENKENESLPNQNSLQNVSFIDEVTPTTTDLLQAMLDVNKSDRDQVSESIKR